MVSRTLPKTQNGVYRLIFERISYSERTHCTPISVFVFLPIRKAKSMYHAMGYSSMLVMQAGMTFDPKDVEAAMTSLRESLETCQR